MGRFVPHCVDPVDVGADSGEDGGLLGKVAAETRAEADDAVNLPGTGRVLAVERTTRVSLRCERWCFDQAS